MVDKEKCCGCSACMSVCPKNCISMCWDKEGFLYPVVDKNICINCGLCEKVCPALRKGEKQTDIKAYACINKDNDVKMSSSSGGAFSVFAEYVLEQNGVVFGAVFDENFAVIHSYIEDKKDLYKLRGSKYVQSDMQDSYRKAQEFLDLERMVLFSGTSCQIAGLKSFLRKEYDNLICVDVICHGVPSPLVFKKYIDQRKKQYGESIKEIRFREKTEGWINYSMKIDFDSQSFRKNARDDEYLRGFIHSLYLRPSCYHCNYKDFTCGSDISLADFWGIKKVLPEFFDKNGVSMVLVNSETGDKIFELVKDKLLVETVNLEDCIRCNSAIVSSAKWNKRRKKVFKKTKSDNVIEVIQKAMESNIINRINMKIRKIIKNKKLIGR